jgi:hypothetical protein
VGLARVRPATTRHHGARRETGLTLQPRAGSPQWNHAPGVAAPGALAGDESNTQNEAEVVSQQLKDVLLQPGKRPQIITECEQLLDEEVASKGGLTGLAVKGAFAMVKAIKPGMIREAIDGLLDDFVNRLEPFYQAQQTSGRSVSDYFTSRAGEVADALLSITDERATRSKNATLKKAYEKLRPQGKKHVEEAMPRLGRLIERHVK